MNSDTIAKRRRIQGGQIADRKASKSSDKLPALKTPR
jgi:hypothetical protein